MVTFERSAVGQIAHALHVIAANAAPAIVLTNRRHTILGPTAKRFSPKDIIMRENLAFLQVR
jgi:hypothetical protein